MAMPSFWSVEVDDGAVVATCPEALRPAGEERPEWMRALLRSDPR